MVVISIYLSGVASALMTANGMFRTSMLFFADCSTVYIGVCRLGYFVFFKVCVCV